jgi:hypothetical protein
METQQTAISFFIYLYVRDSPNVHSSVILDNGKTQEKLVITQETFGMSISRHPIGANGKLMKEIKNKLQNASFKQRKIIIHL